VKTTPRHPPPRLRPRIFGLEECPTFYPNEEEFADPLKYIEYISSPEGGNGREYGIIKIVPPEGWQLPFVLDQGVSDRLTLRMHQC
jgi:[histone H3]-trimethyl-L-lysine4 demethylase